MPRAWGYILVLAAALIGLGSLLIPIPESVEVASIQGLRDDGQASRRNAERRKPDRAKPSARTPSKPAPRPVPRQTSVAKRNMAR